MRCCVVMRCSVAVRLYGVMLILSSCVMVVGVLFVCSVDSMRWLVCVVLIVILVVFVL